MVTFEFSGVIFKKKIFYYVGYCFFYIIVGILTFEIVSGKLKSDPPVIENPHGGPPDNSTTNDIFFLQFLKIS